MFFESINDVAHRPVMFGGDFPPADRLLRMRHMILSAGQIPGQRNPRFFDSDFGHFGAFLGPEEIHFVG